MPGHRAKEIDRYLRTGKYDETYSAWPGGGFCDRAKLGHDLLRRALLAEVRRRMEHSVEPDALLGFDVLAFTRAKVAPMVRGLFPLVEQEPVLAVLGRSVIFLTPSNIGAILRETRWHGTGDTVGLERIAIPA